MIPLMKYTKIIPAAAFLVVMSACGHSNPDIKGGNANPVRVKVMSAASSASTESDSFSRTHQHRASFPLRHRREDPGSDIACPGL